MYTQRNENIGKFLMLLAFPILFAATLDAQKLNKDKSFYYEQRKYHKKEGWVNAVGIHTGNWDELYVALEGIPELPSLQFDYQLYNLIKPRLGLGGGVALNFSPTAQYGYEKLSLYKFAELYAYGKYYLTNNRRRLYVDTKLGYAHAIDKFDFSCYYACSVDNLYLRYNSSYTVHGGLGLEFATARALKWGLKISFYQNAFMQQTDLEPDWWEVTSDGIIKRRTSNVVLRRFLLGVNFYI